MWRQADNPLAPSDKYEVRRTFSVVRLPSVKSRGEKEGRGPCRGAEDACSCRADPQPVFRREVTQSLDYGCN
ncbi:hypothetical protein X777_16126 [Ooceraea biroi]|uniref:Uncharacterized protein n=1 Tax=Ooceraea biroi TaxID=2015173 RepID=A0A026WVC5_OOCBI|nr:hypothetical protein X777_16126 [Ooceraea biroi]